MCIRDRDITDPIDRSTWETRMAIVMPIDANNKMDEFLAIKSKLAADTFLHDVNKPNNKIKNPIPYAIPGTLIFLSMFLNPSWLNLPFIIY